MSDVHGDIVGTGIMKPIGTHGEVGGLDLWGNKIVKKDEAGQKLTVEYGEVVLKDGTIIELAYREFTALMTMLDAGSGGIFRYGTDSAIDTVMIGKVGTKTRVEDAPIDLREQTMDKHLKQRVLKYYKAETNWEKKGWKWQDISVEDGQRLQKAMYTNEGNVREKVRQMYPQYAMEYVTESKDGKELRVERKQDHHYPNVPMERITETGEEVVCWYWAKVYDEKERQRGKVGFKKVIEFVYDEDKGDYVKPNQPDACSPDEVALLDRRGY